MSEAGALEAGSGLPGGDPAAAAPRSGALSWAIALAPFALFSVVLLGFVFVSAVLGFTNEGVGSCGGG